MHTRVLIIFSTHTDRLVEFKLHCVCWALARIKRLYIDMLDIVMLCHIIVVEHYRLVIRGHWVTIVDIVVVAHRLAWELFREGDGVPIGVVSIVVLLVDSHSHWERFVSLVLFKGNVENLTEQKRLGDLKDKRSAAEFTRLLVPEITSLVICTFHLVLERFELINWLIIWLYLMRAEKILYTNNDNNKL